MNINKAVKYTLVYISLIAGVIVIYQFVNDKTHDKFGGDSSNLRIISAELFPNDGFFKKPTRGNFGETVMLRLKLKNLGSKPIQLTSMKVAISNASNLEFKTGAMGKKYISQYPNKNEINTLSPGKELVIAYSRGIRLNGIAKFIKSTPFRSTYYSHTENTNHYMIHDERRINEFNKELSRLYGKNATLNIRIYTGYKKLTKKHAIDITQGTGIFSSDGRMQYHRTLAIMLGMLDGRKIKHYLSSN